METIPDQTSNAGPSPQKPRDDYEWFEEIEDICRRARKYRHDSIKVETAFKLRQIAEAENALQEVKELLCR